MRIELLLSVTLLLAQGCLFDPFDEHWSSDDDWSYEDSAWTSTVPSPDWGYGGYGDEESVDVQRAALQGDMGDLRGIDGEADLTEGYRWGNEVSVTMYVPHARGVAMAALSVREDAPEGEETEVWVTGCAGPSRFEFDFDVTEPGQARRVASPNADVIAYEFEVDLAGDRVRGAFEVARTGRASGRGQTQVVSAGLTGSLAGGSALDGTLVSVDDTHFSTHSSVVLAADSSGGHVDVVVTIWGGLAQLDLGPEGTQTFLAGDPSELITVVAYGSSADGFAEGEASEVTATLLPVGSAGTERLDLKASIDGQPLGIELSFTR